MSANKNIRRGSGASSSRTNGDEADMEYIALRACAYSDSDDDDLDFDRLNSNDFFDTPEAELFNSFPDPGNRYRKQEKLKMTSSKTKQEEKDTKKRIQAARDKKYELRAASSGSPMESGSLTKRKSTKDEAKMRQMSRSLERDEKTLIAETLIRPTRVEVQQRSSYEGEHIVRPPISPVVVTTVLQHSQEDETDCMQETPVTKEDRETYHKKYVLYMNLGRRTFKEREKQERTISENIRYCRQYSDIVYNGRHKINPDNLWMELQAARQGISDAECEEMIKQRRLKSPLKIKELLNFKLEAPQIPITPEYISELLVDPKLSEEYLDYIDSCIVSVEEILDDINLLQTLYPNQNALRRGLAEEGLSTNIVERRLSALHMWLNNSNGLIQTIRHMAALIGVEKFPDISWPFYERTSSLDSTLNNLNIPIESPQSSGRSPTTTSSDSNSESANTTSTKQVKFARVEKDNDTAVQQPQLIQTSVSWDTTSSYTGTSSISIYRPFIDKSLRKSSLQELIKKRSPVVISTLIKARYAINKLESSYNSDAQGAKKAPDMKHIDVMPISADQDPLILEDKIRNREDTDTDICGRSLKDEAEEILLPSLAPLFIFLARTTVDMTHECLRLRLEQAVENPSLQIVRQVVCEYSEAAKISVSVKQCYHFLLWPILHQNGIGEETLEKYLEAYNNDLRHTLEMYFQYVDAAMRMFQREWSPLALKMFLENQWAFSKEICPYINRGMAEAGRQFCSMTSILLQTIQNDVAQKLDESLFGSDLNCSDNPDANPDASGAKLKLCREIKRLFADIREKALKALGIAKLLRKDLEVASEFKIDRTSVKEFLQSLRATDHIRVLTQNKQQNNSYMMFVPHTLKDTKPSILTLLDITCGREDFSTIDNTVDSCPWDSYLLLVNVETNEGHSNQSTTKRCSWNGETITVDTKAETTIALSHIGVKSIYFIVNHSSQLNRLQKQFIQSVNKHVSLINEQTTCHHAIAEAMADLKGIALQLTRDVTEAIKRVELELDANEIDFWDSEKHKAKVSDTYRETLHQCYSLGFDLLQEFNRLVGNSEVISGNAELLISFAHQWMDFVLDKCERGKGTRPRWANPGFDFLSTVVDPHITARLCANKFRDLQDRIQEVIRYIIGEASLTNLNGKTSPHRFPSYDGTKHKHQLKPPTPNGEPVTPVSRSDIHMRPRSSSRSSRISNASSVTSSQGRKSWERTTPDSMIRVRSTSSIHRDMPDMPKFPDSLTPQQRSEFAIKYVEARRDDYLRSQKLIGIEASNASMNNTNLRINVRKVKFKWQRGVKIGEGQFGIVYTAINCDTEEMMALKEIHFQPNDVQTIKCIADELKTFEGITHENLVRYYGVELHRDEMYIFMEYCSAGTLEDAAKQGLLESTIRKYTRELVIAIEHLHEHSIVHRDIKGANIFLISDDKLKLGDFGCSAKLKEHQTMAGEMNAFVGTAAFMAPEVITQKGYGRTADIWSLGCVIVEMVTGKRPWHELDSNYQIMFKVGIGQTPHVPETFHHEGREFLSHCFEVDPSLRSSANELLGHSFIKV